MEYDKIEQAFEKLSKHPGCELTVGGFDVELTRSPQVVKFQTVVFRGGNYIPPSVRACLNSNRILAQNSYSEAALSVDERAFQVVLTYKTPWQPDIRAFKELIESYVGLADDWRWVLNEYGQQDLVHVVAR